MTKNNHINEKKKKKKSITARNDMLITYKLLTSCVNNETLFMEIVFGILPDNNRKLVH